MCFVSKEKMIRLVTITAIVISLLLWSAQAYSEQTNDFLEEAMVEVTDPSCQQVVCNNPQCRVCVTHGHRHGVGMHHGAGIPAVGLPIIGLPCPEFMQGRFLQGGLLQGGLLQGGLLQGGALQGGLSQGRGDGSEDGADLNYVQRLGGTEPVRQCPLQRATVPIPIGPPPSSFVGGVLQPQQYQQIPPMVAGYQGYAQQQGQGYAQGGYGVQAQGVGYAPGYYAPVPEQRIVYVPYAAPPSIHVHMQRGGMMPRPPIMRRILGDANMYEYPEMPLNLYTTRGPRDFFAPNPPSIGE